MKPTLTSCLARLYGALFLACASLACSGVTASDPAPAASTPAAPVRLAAPAPAPAPAGDAAGLMQQLQAAVGSAACTSAAQCKTIAVGHKACGGPESYMAYSTTSNSASIGALAARYAEARKNANQRSGAMSNCMLLRDPGASCSAGRCVTAQPGAAGAVER